MERKIGVVYMQCKYCKRLKPKGEFMLRYGTPERWVWAKAGDVCADCRHERKVSDYIKLGLKI